MRGKELYICAEVVYGELFQSAVGGGLYLRYHLGRLGICHLRHRRLCPLHCWLAGGPFDAVEYATLEWVDWFNHHRLLQPIDNMPPTEKEQGYYRQLEESSIAA